MSVDKLRAEIASLRESVQESEPQKWGNVEQRLFYVQKQMILGVLGFVDGVLLLCLNIFLKAYVLWPLIMYGAVLLLFRQLVLWIIMLMIQIGKPLVVILNSILFFMWVGVNIAIEAIKVVIDAINTIIPGSPIHSSLRLWKKVPDISFSEFENTLKGVLTAAPEFNSMPKIFLFFMRVLLHDYTCPLVRYTYPVNFVYAVSQWFLSWTYYGDAEPLLETNKNCMASTDVTVYDYFAAALGLGYLFLEFFLPCVILFLVILFLGSALLKLANLTFYLFTNLSILGIEIALTALDFVFV